MPAPPARRRSPWPGLPRRCAVCETWGTRRLCTPCLQRFARPRPRCLTCAEPAPCSQRCGACLRNPPPQVRTVAAVDYGFPWAGLIGRFKFDGQPELAGALAPLLADAVASAAAQPVSLLLPVPLSAGRLAERGYNQAWELARRLARGTFLPARDDLLLRVRDTPHQVGLGRAQRLRNLRDAFWVPPAAQPRLQGRAVAVVDDVMTTGVTAAAASLALLAAGAASVQLWVLARTPAPDDPVA